MPYHVKVLAKADSDVESIARWLAKRSPQGATSWLDADHIALEKLSENPLMYAEAPESHRFSFELRQMMFKTRMGRRYRLLFTVEDNGVIILRVRRPGQQPVRKRDLPKF